MFAVSTNSLFCFASDGCVVFAKQSRPVVQELERRFFHNLRSEDVDAPGVRQAFHTREEREGLLTALRNLL